MIDTNTVNYALDKIAEAYRAVAPTVGHISEKYVTYIMWQQIVPFITSCFVLLLGLLVLGVGVTLICKTPVVTDALGDKKLNTDSLKFGFGSASTIISIFLLVGGLIGFFNCGQDVLLCYKNPEMFAVEQLIQSTKK